MGDGWSIAWRVHDAQFWGVPQRRKRISLIADFGGHAAPEILFERKGMSGDITESGEPGKRVTKDTERGIRETSASGFPLGFRAENTKTYDEKATTICNGTRPGFTCGVIQGFDAYNQATNGEAGKVIGFHLTQDPVSSDELSYACSCGNSKSGQCVNGVVYGIGGYNSKGMLSNNPKSGIYQVETSRTLDLNGGSPACNQGGMAVVQSAGFDGNMGAKAGNIGYEEEKAPTLNAGKQMQCICIEGNGSRPSHRGDGYSESETMYTLNSTEHQDICYDARGNGSGKIAPTITGDHQSRVTDYTAIAISEVAAGLCAQDGRGGVHSQRLADPEGNFVLEPVVASKASHFTHGIEGGVSDTLYATDYKEPQLVAFTTEMTPKVDETGKAFSLRSRDYKDAPSVAYGIDCYNQTQSTEKTQTLRAKATDSDHIPCTYGIDRAAYNQGKNALYDFSVEEEKIATQVAKGPGAVCAAENCQKVESIVRRLTPMECERLQGYPDGWTDIGDWTDSKGKKHKGDSDAPRYKALGNSIALPFWEWMAKRMTAYITDHRPTMASLFDGIGGFPLVFSRSGADPIWASEIEEFPIAVTKIRFPEKEEE